MDPSLQVENSAYSQDKYDFRHVTSSPEFPRANGLAEKRVQVVKRILKKTNEAGEYFWLGLPNYQSTPLEGGRSAGELLQGRQLRSTLPDFNVQEKVKVQKHIQFDRSKGPLPPLKEGQVVRIKRKAWSPKAKVIGQTHPRSYNALTQGNKLIRRNRRHLLPTKETFNPDDLGDLSDDHVRHSTPATPVNPGENPTQDVQVTVQPSAGDNLAQVTPQASALLPRRSSRQRRPPKRLQYDQNFNQVS
ncbi:uncharacterized protein LOC119443206 [Dermacentor silvarum]|uniref:uncharacterized protein LOC119443206 n=1 Tax=Dermacentor silvarum TaxID=543639 RepID=UPI00189BD0E5|nr:uncharacterized protein LOC119443206 [Dermacentor silvarum]